MQKQSNISDSRKGQSQASDASPPIDPVCGMELEGSMDKLEQIEHDGATYYFCSTDCRERFEAAPEDFIS